MPQRVSSALGYNTNSVLKYESDSFQSQKMQHCLSDISYTSNYLDRYAHSDFVE